MHFGIATAGCQQEPAGPPAGTRRTRPAGAHYRPGMGSEAGTPSTVRCTEPEALRNVAAVLQLCQAGRLRCSATTRRPSAATVTAVREVLVAGDFYPDEAIAAFAWPLLLQA